VQYSHIKGHQDKGYPTALSQTVWLNIEIDLITKSRIESQHQVQQGYKLLYKPWHLAIGGLQTAQHPKHALQNALNGPPAQQYWKAKMPSLSHSLIELDTHAMEQAMWEIPAHKHR